MPEHNPMRVLNGRYPVNSTPESRAINGQNLTPRLAGSPASIISPTIARDAKWDGSRPKVLAQEEVETPVKAFLSSNITPRSASRKSRLESTLSTPAGTPTGTPSRSKASSTVNANGQAGEESHRIYTIGSREPEKKQTGRPRSLISIGNDSTKSQGRASPERGVSVRSGTSPERSQNRYTRINGRSSFSSNVSNQTPKSQGKTAGFVYANGEEEGETESSSASASSPPETHQAKFFHADAIQAPRSLQTNLKLYATPQSSPIQSPNVGTFSPANSHQPRRPPSPLKDSAIPRKASVSTVNGRPTAPVIPTTATQRQIPKPSGIPSPVGSNASRRSSLKAAPKSTISHGKSNSINSIDQKAQRRTTLNTPADSVLATWEQPKPLLVAEPKSIDDDVPTSPPTSPPQPQSPSKLGSTESKLDHLNELAANARRERKVLDLEISNSSLLAINRTLEREMHKQNAELRRYRRLEHSGRLSIAPSNRSFSNHNRLSTITSTTEATTDFSGLSELDDSYDLDLEDEDLEAFSDEALSQLDFISTDPNSPTSQFDSLARARARTSARQKREKVEALDLTRFQAMLVDSQKMNQSLRRCLDCTEELIAEGKKALDYKVPIREVEEQRERGRGGRVLSPDEVEGSVERGRGLLSPAIDVGQNPLEVLSPERQIMGSPLDLDGARGSPDWPPGGSEVDDESGPEPEAGSGGVEEPQPQPQPPTPESSGTGLIGLGFKNYLESLGESWSI